MYRQQRYTIPGTWYGNGVKWGLRPLQYCCCAVFCFRLFVFPAGGGGGWGEAYVDRRLKRGFSACPPGKCAGEKQEREGGAGVRRFLVLMLLMLVGVVVVLADADAQTN